MPITGQFDRLRELIQGLKDIRRPAFRRELCADLAGEAHSLVVDAFTTSTDPYGKPWKPSRQRRRGGRGYSVRGRGQILRDTNRLFSSIHSRATTTGFRIWTNVHYAAIHNFGGTIRQAPRTELRAYRESSAGRRTRVDLGSRARRRVLKGVSIGERAIGMPRRMFIPPATDIGVRWRRALKAVVVEHTRRTLEP